MYKANAEHMLYFSYCHTRQPRGAAVLPWQLTRGRKGSDSSLIDGCLSDTFTPIPACPEDAGSSQPAAWGSAQSREEAHGPAGPQEALPSPGPAPPRSRQEAGPRRAAPLRLGVSRRDAAASAMSWRSGSRGVVLTAYHPSGGAGDAPGGWVEARAGSGEGRRALPAAGALGGGGSGCRAAEEERSRLSANLLRGRRCFLRPRG